MKYLLQTLFFILLATQICSAQWVQTNYPSNTMPLCLAANESSLFATVEWGDIFLSSDNGDSWNYIDSGLTCDSYHAITFSGQNVIAGAAGGRCGGIDISTDNGMNWSGVLPDFRVLSLTSHDNNVFAGTWGVLFSSDNGMTWDSVNSGLPSDCIITALTISGSKTFAGCEYGVFKTTDNGTNWVAVNNGLSNLSILKFAVSGNHLFAGTEDGIFLTTDDGANWDSVNMGLPSGPQITDIAVLDSYIFISITYYQSNILNSNVYLSTNYGEIWDDVSSGLLIDGDWISSLTIKDNFLFAADNNGVWRRPLSEMITDVEDIATKPPDNFIVLQNYPNPFNPTTKIKYSIPQNSQVQIKVFDVLGNEITTLANGEKQTGTYELNWNANNIPSGVYFVWLQASPPGGKDGGYTAVKKMLLLK